MVICHLCDIHFAQKNNAILDKREKLCNAILQNTMKRDTILIVVSGDIAQSGQKEEYNIALDFFLKIQSCLEERKNLRVFYFFTPGNHDCDFTDEERNKDDNLRREKLINEKNSISNEDLEYYIKGLCFKQQNYRDFVNLFEYEAQEGYRVEKVSCSELLTQYEITIDGSVLLLNLLNSAWLSELNEHPGNFYFPEKEYKKINKRGSIVITAYHHPSNWMHPNDRNEFNRWVMNESDLVYVGHEHIGRNEEIETRDTVYNAQYGEVLQDREDDKNSGFIMTYINRDDRQTYVYKWDSKQEIYNIVYEYVGKIKDTGKKYLCFQKDFQNYLETADIRISHPNKKNVSLRDLYVYPDIEAYKDAGNFDTNQDSITIKGEELVAYILKTKKIAFSGGSKSGKTALAKNLSIDLMERGKYSIIFDCSKIGTVSNRNLKRFEEICVTKAYGKDYINAYEQLEEKNKVIIIDNFEKIHDRSAKKAILDYFNNYYGYILTFSNTTFELEILDESLDREKSGLIHCSISEMGHKKRNQLIKKWYYLVEDDGIIVDDFVNNKIAEAMSVINTLKGNGYMPCIPPHILIILQQLEYSVDGSNQERSNYGYLYEFLITKSILDMNQNCEYIHKDIAFGILTNVAAHMLEQGTKVIHTETYRDIVYQYNKDFQTDANAEQYINEYGKVELLNEKDNQVSFVYPYIHYYFTAKYLANNMSEDWAKKKILNMSQHLYEEECGDIMIFLCHLSKDEYIISSVLENSKNILSDKEIYNFKEHKMINLSFDNYIQADFIPEKDIEGRKEALLDMQDRQEKQIKKEKEKEVLAENREYVYCLDNAFKTIEVMGQILKNYPGTIKGTVKNELLESIYNLGMRSLTYTSDVLYGGLERIFEDIRRKLQPNPSQIELDKVGQLVGKLNHSMDNIFGFLSYAMIRNLANSVANKALLPVISQSVLRSEVGYNLVRNAIDLNEFGIISVDLILKEYDKYQAEENIFAAKLLRLLVLDHYYVYGSKDYKNRQRIWNKMKFGKRENVLALQGSKR